jgi:predicted MFS family arabinose efflux permease
VLGSPVFRRFYASRVISLVGDAMVPTALAISVVDRVDSPDWLGAILAAAILPKVLFLAFGGIAADRFLKRDLMIGSALVCGVAQLGSACALFTGGSLWWVLAGQVLYGLSAAVGFPATFSYLPRCVEPHRLGAANGLLGASAGAASMLGPAIAAAMLLAGPPPALLVADAASFLLSACLLVGLPAGGPTGRPDGGLAALRDGWRALRDVPWLLRMTAVDSLILLLVAAPFMVLGPGIVEHRLDNGWVLVMISFSVGEFVGGIASGRARLRRPLFAAALGLVLMAFPPMLLASGAGVVALCVAECGAGIGIAAYGVLVNTAIQRDVPAGYLARVSAISSIGSFAALPVGYVVAAPLAGVLGPGPLLWVASAWTLVSVGVLVSDGRLRAARDMSP